MSIKFGRDRKSVNALSNDVIVQKSKFVPREYNKVQSVLTKRGLQWKTTQ